MSRSFTLLSLGPSSVHSRRAWTADEAIVDEIRFSRAAPSGLRFGRRVTGMGVDALVLAVKVKMSSRRNRTYLCANPWIAVALRVVGESDFAVTGIYAEPGTSSWKLLRWAVGARPVVTLVDVEAEAWNSEGGNATPVLYGNTFRYPLASMVETVPRVFVGGTSDRDEHLMERLVEEIRRDTQTVELVVADGSGPKHWAGERSTITWLPRITNADFGSQMASCHVVFLPLLEKRRAAGHMVTVGALECGLTTLTTAVPGMNGYVDGQHVRVVDAAQPILEQLLGIVSTETVDTRRVTFAFWKARFSLDAYVRRVMQAISDAY